MAFEIGETISFLQQDRFAASSGLKKVIPDNIAKAAAPPPTTARGFVDGVSERALFVIDNRGEIFWSYCSPIAVNPGADGILEALENMPNERKNGHGHAQSSSHAA
jgi:hypothetical protein